MRKIFLHLFLLFFILSKNSITKEKDLEIYCLNDYSKTVFSIFVKDEVPKNVFDRCRINYDTDTFFEIPKKLYEIFKYEQDLWAEKGSKVKGTTFLGKPIYNSDDPNFHKDFKNALEEIAKSNIDQINNLKQKAEQAQKIFDEKSKNEAAKEAKKIKEKEENEKKARLAYLDQTYRKKCLSKKNNTNEYNSCLFETEKLALAEKAEQDRKISQAKLDEQNKLAKAKFDEQKRLANLPPSERYAYTCEKTYGFKKGSDNFRDCVFKIMTTEYEMQAQINQRRIAELESRISGMERSTSASNSYNSEMLEIERMKAKAMQDQVNFARNKDITDTLLGISSNLLNPPSRPAPNSPQMFNCQTRKFGGFDQIQCF